MEDFRSTAIRTVTEFDGWWATVHTPTGLFKIEFFTKRDLQCFALDMIDIVRRTKSTISSIPVVLPHYDSVQASFTKVHKKPYIDEEKPWDFFATAFDPDDPYKKAREEFEAKLAALTEEEREHGYDPNAISAAELFGYVKYEKEKQSDVDTEDSEQEQSSELSELSELPEEEYLELVERHEEKQTHVEMEESEQEQLSELSELPEEEYLELVNGIREMQTYVELEGSEQSEDEETEESEQSEDEETEESEQSEVSEVEESE